MWLHLGVTRQPVAASEISESLLQDALGASKIFKGGRAEQYLQAAEALKDPDQIGVDWERNEKTGGSRCGIDTCVMTAKTRKSPW